MFDFGVSFCDLFKVDVSTELHRLMRHVHNHLIHLGCLRRGSSDENEVEHKELKCLYSGINKHIDSIAVQLLNPWVRYRHTNAPFHTDRPTFKKQPSAPPSPIFKFSFSATRYLVRYISGFIPHSKIAHKILQLQYNGARRWHRIKTLVLSAHIPSYNSIMYTFLFEGQQDYGKWERHDSVLYLVDNEQYVLIEGVIFDYYSTDTGNCCMLVLHRRLHSIDPDPGNVCSSKHFAIKVIHNLCTAHSIFKPI